MAVQIQLRRGTAAEWTSANPTLAAGEMGLETDTNKYKIGDGSTAWTSLTYSSLPSNAIDANIVDAKGDLIVATADNTVSRLAVGSDGQALVADSAETSGLKWGAVDDTTKIAKSIVDAKGDLIVATADNTVSRLAVGTNGYGLVADSAEASGLKWAAVGDVTTSGAQTLTNKTISLTNNTITGNVSQFNAALSDDDFVSQSGSEYLTNKTLNNPFLERFSAVYPFKYSEYADGQLTINLAQGAFFYFNQVTYNVNFDFWWNMATDTTLGGKAEYQYSYGKVRVVLRTQGTARTLGTWKVDSDTWNVSVFAVNAAIPTTLSTWRDHFFDVDITKWSSGWQLYVNYYSYAN